MFPDIDLLMELVDRYGPITYIIRALDGEVLVIIDAESSRKAFDLHPALDKTDEIDFKLFEEAFDKVRSGMQHKLISSFLKVDGIKLTPLAISNSIGNCEHFNDTIVYTHTALYQVLGLTNIRKFSKSI